jgi:carboxyl-terminal processing protease
MNRLGAASLATLAVFGAVALGTGLVRDPTPTTKVTSTPRAPTERSEDALDTAPEPSERECNPGLDLVAPTGRPAAISCATARAIVREVRARFATPIERPPVPLFADLVVSWLDPHGLWSDAPDAPTAARIGAESAALLAEIEADPASSRPCHAAAVLGDALASWLGELGVEYDRARNEAPALSAPEATTLALLSPFQDEGVPARRLAAELGRYAGSVERSLGQGVLAYTREARHRYLPVLTPPGWHGVVLASAVRAYVASVDAHGRWSPLDEEWALYAGDLSFDDGDRLWGDMLRTAVGVRIVDRPTPPLDVDDLVLAVNGTSVAGMAVEQVGQLSRAAPGAGSERSVVVLRAGWEEPRVLTVPPLGELADDDATRAPEDQALEVELVPYGTKQAASITVRYVGDDLGERLEALVAELAARGEPPVGIVLDLRGNGGGSTDGAADALGVFLPGVPAFPLLHAGRVTEVLSAPVPHPKGRFLGPLAVLVDARTASAAEMLAGALDRYGRATLLGAPTFGKGCVQEYFRDHTGAGALRLTTHLFALPDGSPIQRRGLVPSLSLDVERLGERERDLPGAIHAVSAPDVRVPVGPFPGWPRVRGAPGPCEDAVVCSALRRLSGRPLATAARSDDPAKRRSPR